MIEPAYILGLAIAFMVGFICGMKFIMWRLSVERGRSEAAHAGRNPHLPRHCLTTHP